MSTDPIQQSENQKDPYLTRPEDFIVRKYDDPLKEEWPGQSENDAEAKMRSREQKNRGSVRAEGNVNHSK